MPALELFQEHVAQFHELRKIFITSGVCASISLPQQHAVTSQRLVLLDLSVFGYLAFEYLLPSCAS
jgi:hypothetical protein